MPQLLHTFEYFLTTLSHLLILSVPMPLPLFVCLLFGERVLMRSFALDCFVISINPFSGLRPSFHCLFSAYFHQIFYSASHFLMKSVMSTWRSGLSCLNKCPWFHDTIHIIEVSPIRTASTLYRPSIQHRRRTILKTLTWTWTWNLLSNYKHTRHIWNIQK